MFPSYMGIKVLLATNTIKFRPVIWDKWFWNCCNSAYSNSISLPITTCESKNRRTIAHIMRDAIDHSVGKPGLVLVDWQFRNASLRTDSVCLHPLISPTAMYINFYWILVLLEPTPPLLASEDTSIAPSSPPRISPSLSTRDICT